MIDWKEWSTKVVKEKHGDLYYYRDLYDGNHANLFPRAKKLIEQGDVVDIIVNGRATAKNVQTPYIIANIAKLVAEVPATLISRSIGKVTTSLENEEERNDDATERTSDMIDGTEDGGYNSEIADLQQELIDQISENSGIAYEHWGNIVQNQVDGGLVGVPRYDAQGLRIEFKSRDVYFPHEDGLGADLVYQRTFDEDKYLHVYRERVEFTVRTEGTERITDRKLVASNLLYRMTGTEGRLERVDDDLAQLMLGLPALRAEYPGRGRELIEYWPNQRTFMHPLGVSALKNQEGKQEEINWTLTRNALTFERNGKPRIAVSQEVFRELQNKALDRYGNEDMIDHRDLEITTFDENGNALEVIQIDITKIGDISWVKDLVKMMLMETQTSEKAVDFYLDGQGTTADSGIAKFYDLFVSLVKAEQVRSEYVHFLKQLYKNALWIAANDDDAIRIEEPDIQLSDMVPISGKESAEQNVLAFEKGTQSLETTVRRLNPEASEEWIEEEVARIEAGAGPDDTTSLLRGRQSLSNYLDNPDTRGQGGADETDAEGITATAPAPDEDAKALNGAQITSVLAIIEQVTNGQITAEQGRALLVDGLKLSEDTADKVIR